MSITPVLALLYFIKAFTIECDAYGQGLGAAFMQEQRLMAPLGLGVLKVSALQEKIFGPKRAFEFVP